MEQLKEGSKTFLSPRSAELWKQYGQKDLASTVKSLILWYTNDKVSSHYPAVQNTVAQCRKGIVSKTGCKMSEAQVLALGLSRLRVWSPGFAKSTSRYNFIFTEEPIGSRRPLVTGRIDTKSLPEMQSTVMQKAQNTRFSVCSPIHEWLNSIDLETNADLKLTLWQLEAADWMNGREYMLNVFRDDNTRQYRDVYLSPNGDSTAKNLVQFAEVRSITDAQLLIWSANLDKEFGVNLDNCSDIWERRTELLVSGKLPQRAIGNAYHLAEARKTKKTQAIARVDRYMAMAQEHGMWANCRTTLRNTNVICDGTIRDPWMLIASELVKRQDWIRDLLSASQRRSLAKLPGTPSAYQASLASASKAVVGAGDDARKMKDIRTAVEEDLIEGAKPYVRDMILSRLGTCGVDVTNANILKLCTSIASGVRKGQAKYTPASACCGKQFSEALKVTGKDTKWTTNGIERSFDPWVLSGEIDEDSSTGKFTTESFSTTVYLPHLDVMKECSCSLRPLLERDPASVLYGLPVASFKVERMAEDWKQYNAPFPILDNHDEDQVSPADLPEMGEINRKGLIYAHFTEASPLEQVRKAAGLPVRKLEASPITKEEVSEHFSG